MFGLHLKFFSQKDECMHGVVNGIYLWTFSQMCVTFRDESNEPSFTMIGYSDVTVTTPNHPLIMRSKILLATTHTTVS